MAILAVAMTKQMIWRDVEERFANVYHYEVPTADEATALAVIDRLEALEGGIHSSNITFVEARAWSAGGTPQDNETVALVDLASTGSAMPEDSQYRECTLDVRWRTDRRSVLDRPVYLRKYFHTNSLNGEPMTANQRAGAEKLPATVQTWIRDVAILMGNLDTTAGQFPITAPSGRIAAKEPEVDPYVQHHELKY